MNLNGLSACSLRLRSTSHDHTYPLFALLCGADVLLCSALLDLLKNKSRPEAAADGASDWVQSEREMRERLAREREAREVKETILCQLKLNGDKGSSR